MKNRKVWEWLVLILWIEISALLMFRGWLKEKAMLIDMTNLLSAIPDGSWWILMSNMTILVLGMGIALWYLRRYGSIVGLSIFVAGLIIWEGI